MATIVDTYQKDGETINVYESGVHYNVTKGRLIKAAESALITPEKSKKYKEMLAEKKRQAILQGAAKALEKIEKRESTPNDIDVVEAIGEAVMRKAMNSDNPKQVDAARFVLQESGLAESQTKSDESTQQFAGAASAVAELVGILRQVLEPRDVIDGRVTDVINGNNDTRNE